MKKLYIKIVESLTKGLTFTLDKTMRHLVVLNNKNPDAIPKLKFDLAAENLLGALATLSVNAGKYTDLIKSPTTKFGHLFSRVNGPGVNTNKGVTIIVPHVQFPVNIKNEIKIEDESQRVSE
jgi:hypothetical protein